MAIPSRFTCRLCLLLLAPALMLGGCGLLQPRRAKVESARTAAPVRQTAGVAHTVGRGETLYAIAKHYSGDGKNWPDIAAANPRLNPNKLSPGDRVVIPFTLFAAAPVAYHETQDSRRARLSPAAQIESDGIPAPKSASKAQKADKKKKTAAAKPQQLAKRKAEPAKAIATKPAQRKAAPVQLASDEDELADYPAPPKLMAKADIAAPAPAPAAAPPPAPMKSHAPIDDPAPIQAPAPARITAPPPAAPVVHVPPPALESEPESTPRFEPPAKPAPIKPTFRKIEPISSTPKGAKSAKSKTSREPAAPSLNGDPQQVSRSSFYSCSADKCSLRSF